MTVTKESTLATIKRLIDEALRPKSRLGAMMNKSCCYYSGNKRCAIGYLLDATTLDLIRQKELNFDTSASSLYRKLGDLSHLTGVSADMADRLQDVHDVYYNDLPQAAHIYQLLYEEIESDQTPYLDRHGYV